MAPSPIKTLNKLKTKSRVAKIRKTKTTYTNKSHLNKIEKLMVKLGNKKDKITIETIN